MAVKVTEAEIKVGDKVSVDAFKVGQPRRTGTVVSVTKGISGTRYLVRWDDGHESFFSPSAGNLIVEKGGNARKGSAGKAGAKIAQKKPGAKGKR